MIILALGTYRFWRQQNAMLRGKVHAGGWETNAVGILIVVVCIICRSIRAQKLIQEQAIVLIFVLLIAVDIEKTS